MYVGIFITGFIVFYRRSQNVCVVTLADTFQHQSHFLCMRVTNWTNIVVDQGQFSDLDVISGTHQRKNVQFADTTFIGQITSWSTIDTRLKMRILTQNNCSFEPTISPSTIDTFQKMSTLIQDNCLFEQTTSRSTIENLHEMSVLTPTHIRTKLMCIRTNNFPFHYWHPSKDNSHTLKILVCCH